MTDKTTPKTDDKAPTVEELQAQLDARNKEIEEAKEKFSASAKENEVYRRKLKKQEEEEAKKAAQASSERLMKIYPNWDDMDESQQAIARRQEELAHKLGSVEKEVTTFSTDRAWSTKVDSFLETVVADERFKVLESNKKAFKRFVNKPTRRGSDLSDLAAAFLFDPENAPKPQEKKGTSVLQSPNGGAGKAPAQPKKLSVEQSAALRKTNHKEWMKKVESGEIDI